MVFVHFLTILISMLTERFRESFWISSDSSKEAKTPNLNLCPDRLVSALIGSWNGFIINFILPHHDAGIAVVLFMLKIVVSELDKNVFKGLKNNKLLTLIREKYITWFLSTFSPVFWSRPIIVQRVHNESALNIRENVENDSQICR